MIINPYIFGGFDPDAQAFITAANITNTTQQNAINTLVVDLKGYGVWSKMKAIYPFVGGTATTHKFNLKDPRDLDVAFRLVFNGGWTHSSTGALPNGTNGFANTYLIPSTSLNLTSSHISLYSRTSVAAIAGQGGARSGTYISNNQNMSLAIRRPDNLHYTSMFSETFFANGGSNTDARGFYLGTRTANNLIRLYKNGLTVVSNTNIETGSSLPNTYIFLSSSSNSVNGVTPNSYDNKELAFSSIGDGLTDTEASNLYLAVQNYQVALSRQV